MIVAPEGAGGFRSVEENGRHPVYRKRDGVWLGLAIRHPCLGGEMVRVKGEIIIIADNIDLPWAELKISMCRIISFNSSMYDSVGHILKCYREDYPNCRVEWLTGPKVAQLSVAEINRANGQPELL